MAEYRFDKIFIHERSRNETAERICGNLPGVPFRTVRDTQEVRDYVYSNYEDVVAGGKKILYLTVNPGEKIKRCPCTSGKTGCGYYVINLHTNCPIDCSYCILQNYLNNPFITVFTNIYDYLEDISSGIKENPGYFRVGTGELTDSLAIDHVTGYSKILLEFFRQHENTILELKTKSDCIGNLLKIEPPKNVVISWSLNPQCIIESDEKLSASLDERLKGAETLLKLGYRLAFHFDPLVILPCWKKQYSELIDRVFGTVNAERLEWISLGALRFDPKLKDMIMERFPKSRLVLDEFIHCKDNKLRYLRKVRAELFSFMSSRIRKYSSKPYVYLCMEDDGLWREAGLCQSFCR